MSRISADVRYSILIWHTMIFVSLFAKSSAELTALVEEWSKWIIVDIYPFRVCLRSAQGNITHAFGRGRSTVDIISHFFFVLTFSILPHPNSGITWNYALQRKKYKRMKRKFKKWVKRKLEEKREQKKKKEWKKKRKGKRNNKYK